MQNFDAKNEWSLIIETEDMGLEYICRFLC